MVLLDLGAGLAPSWLPFALAVFLLGVLALLWFSMRRHLKRADYPDLPTADEARAGTPTTVATPHTAASPTSPGETGKV